MTAPAHIFKTARRQMKKIRHRGARTETERRLLASADQQREQGLGWRYDGFDGFTTEQMFAALRRFGIEHDQNSLRAEALEAGSPTRLAERWEARSSAQGKWRDLPLLAARELWRRLLPEVRCAEVVADEIDELLTEAEVGAERAGLWREAARRLVAACIREGQGDRAFFQAVVRESGSDLVGWMIEMPAILLDTVDAALAPGLALQFAQLGDEKAMLSERSELLGHLGHREEALAQLEELFQRFPDDPVVLLKAGATLEALGELASSQEYYRRYAEAMQSPASSRSLAAAAKAGVDLPPRPGAPARAPSVGPNDRCPCGSGKKYKRCHGLPS